MPNRWLGSADVPRGDAYDARFTALAEAGQDVHGEAHFVASLGGTSVLDAGCGTGRVAIELARRGFDTVGVDLDATMLEVARRKAPHLPWYVGDLTTIELMTSASPAQQRHFDVIVLAGNVMIFLAPGSEATVIANLARFLAPGGALVAGFQLTSPALTLAQYDQYTAQAGLTLTERWATWDRQPWHAASDYAVSVHRQVPRMP
ncbi:MAG: class I SAM-dependent methyltransferase [Candidatus Tectomicrobia bacterium]|uniref:Class I SAM-dependent methyltransferase n=1 Tax=Tectimicrobiota bacterium TaxID=2528274 RepID=A0A938B1A1_UNCTE|nr:class I SAM-dependent methyltransferase [Candidatus Tectomicrobia bacterium]